MTRQRIHRRRYPLRSNGTRRYGKYRVGSRKAPILKRKPRVFVSFHKEDRYAKELLTAQARNKNIDLQFSEQSVKRPFKSKWKTRMKPRIQNASTTVVMVGKKTYNRDAVNWEIEQSRKAGNKIVAVQINRDQHHRLPPSVRKSEEIRWDIDTLSRRLRRRK